MKRRTKLDCIYLSLAVLLVISITVTVFSLIRSNGISRKAIHNKVLQHGKQIALALRAFASDNQGMYPNGASANEALGQVVSDIETEKIFYVPNSPWCLKEGPDNLWESSEPTAGKALDAGENGYAINKFVINDTPPKNPKTPWIIAVSINPDEDTRSITVIYADGSGETLPIEDHETYEPGSTTVLDRFPDADWLLPVPPAASE